MTILMRSGLLSALVERPRHLRFGLVLTCALATCGDAGTGPSSGDQPSISTTVLRDGIMGEVYADSLRTTEGLSPYSWSIVGALPDGLTFTVGGAITGTPTAAGYFSFTVTVTGHDGSSSTRDLSITTWDCESPIRCGQIADLQVAQDIIDFNMTPRGHRTQGVICRWELPIPVYLSPILESADYERTVAALNHWRSIAGITYSIMQEDTLPRLLIRTGTDGLPPGYGGRAGVFGTFPDNSARNGLVVIRPDGGAACRSPEVQSCRNLYRHELGHAYGIFGHILRDNSVLDGGGSHPSRREAAMMRTLYKLPHGAIVSPGGVWRVPPPESEEP